MKVVRSLLSAVAEVSVVSLAEAVEVAVVLAVDAVVPKLAPLSKSVD